MVRSLYAYILNLFLYARVHEEGEREGGGGGGGIRALCAEVLANMDWLPPSAAYLPSPSSPDPPTCRHQRQRIGGERIGGGGGGGGGYLLSWHQCFARRLR